VNTFWKRNKGLKRTITLTRRTRRRRGIKGFVEMPIQGSSCNVSDEKESQNPYHQSEGFLLPPIHLRKLQCCGTKLQKKRILTAIIIFLLKLGLVSRFAYSKLHPHVYVLLSYVPYTHPLPLFSLILFIINKFNLAFLSYLI